MKFDEKTIIVTGGASGIGERLGERFAAHDANVVLADVRDPSDAAADLGTTALGVETDVTDPEDVERLVERTVDRFGGVDVLVNNAAIYAPLVPKRDRSFDEIPLDEWREVLEVNTTGVFLCCQAAIPEMIDRGRGSVVNVASAVMYGGVTGYPHYVTSKGAIPPLTRALATEVGEHGVRVNAVAPGLVTTAASQQLDDAYFDALADKQCLQRNGTPADVVDVVEFLASEKSSFVTGSTLHPDGGLSFR